MSSALCGARGRRPPHDRLLEGLQVPIAHVCLLSPFESLVPFLLLPLLSCVLFPYFNFRPNHIALHLGYPPSSPIPLPEPIVGHGWSQSLHSESG